MPSESNQENITLSITENKKPDQTAPLENLDINELRKNIKTNSLTMINNCLVTFTKMIDEGVTIEKYDALNSLILQTFMYIDTNLSNIIAIDDDLIYTNEEMKELDPSKLISVYELVLWKRINTHLDDQFKMGILDNIEFLRDTRDFINNILYKNINVK